MTHVSTELQRTVRAITSVRGVDLFGFADAGLVWGDARSSTDLVILTNQDFRSRNWRSGLGGASVSPLAQSGRTSGSRPQ